MFVIEGLWSVVYLNFLLISVENPNELNLLQIFATNIRTHSVSYTHLDVYKRQVLNCSYRTFNTMIVHRRFDKNTLKHRFSGYEYL